MFAIALLQQGTSVGHRTTTLLKKTTGVVIFTTMRAGSSFLGELFNQHSQVRLKQNMRSTSARLWKFRRVVKNCFCYTAAKKLADKQSVPFGNRAFKFLAEGSIRESCWWM